jgi:hypothetical protein
MKGLIAARLLPFFNSSAFGQKPSVRDPGH